jgi:hypothetical protein
MPARREDVFESVDVPTTPFAPLLEKHSIDGFQLLCVDTEGFDFEILKLVELARFRPEVVLFESKNLSDSDYIAAKAMLTDLGYQLYWDRGDTLATRIDYPVSARVRAVLRRWRRRVQKLFGS